MRSALSRDEGEVFTLLELARRLPFKPHKNTLHRWASKGIKGTRLRTFKVGGRTCTSERAWQEFQAATNGSVAASSAHAAAEAELDRLNV